MKISFIISKLHLVVLVSAILAILLFSVMPAHSQGAGEAFSCNADPVCEMNGFRLGSSTTPGYVLTADASGAGVWQQLDAAAIPYISGKGSVNYVTHWNSAKALGNSMSHDNGASVGIGTSTPEANLEIKGSGVSTIGVQMRVLDRTWDPTLLLTLNDVDPGYGGGAYNTGEHRLIMSSNKIGASLSSQKLDVTGNDRDTAAPGSAQIATGVYGYCSTAGTAFSPASYSGGSCNCPSGYTRITLGHDHLYCDYSEYPKGCATYYYACYKN